MDYQILSDHGIDWKSGIARCMNDEDFYRQLLGMFLEDTSFRRGETAFNEKKYRDLFSCMHELKGVCGNIDIRDLFTKVSALVELLRNNGGTEEEISPAFAAVREEYTRAMDGIRKALAAD